ncbi:MAG TPA: TIGR01244 family sulfur transferase [Allosphingosinicella sp.]
MKQLDSKTLVAGQVMPSDIPALAAAGVTMIVNNRPDGEEPAQPAAAAVEAAARAAGLGYRHIPIAGGFNGDDILAMAEALDAAGEGRVLAFCKSGTRSCYLWALARAERGGKAEEIVAAAEAAGYDFSPIRSYL